MSVKEENTSQKAKRPEIQKVKVRRYAKWILRRANFLIEGFSFQRDGIILKVFFYKSNDR
jgi:hypothetical protein